MVKNPVSLNELVSHKYDDIINMEYPLKNADTIKHPRMSIQNRAKIFAPCATLKGYEKAIEAKQRIVVDKIELSEETKEFLDMQLNKINNLLLQKKHPIITVVYFQGDNKNIDEKGEYIQFTGMVAKLNVVSRIIQIVEKRIFFDDIYAITGEEMEIL